MNLEPVSSRTSAQSGAHLQDLEEDQAISVRITKPEFARAPAGFVHFDVVVEDAHCLEFGMERVRIVDGNSELEASEGPVVEVRLILTMHMEPDVVAADTGVILGVLFVPEVDVESKTVRIETDGFFNVTDVENWNSWTKSGVCHIKKVWGALACAIPYSGVRRSAWHATD